MYLSTVLRKLVAPAALAVVAASGLALAGATSASASTVIFDNTNGYGVTQASPMPPAYTLFTLTRPETVTSVSTYHWDNGHGTPYAGMIYILVPHSGGQVWAKAQAQGSPGQGGVPNANWTATFNVTLSAGQWQIWDSSPTTWSYDAQSGGAGFADVEGNAASSSPPAPSRPCFHNTYSPLEMGPCSGPRGTTVVIEVVSALPSPLARLMLTNGAGARVYINGFTGNGVVPGSYYTFPAPAQLCLAGPGSSTWEAYAWDAAGLNKPAYSLYGTEGNFGRFTVTGC
jgi:hypothetical protein